MSGAPELSTGDRLAVDRTSLAHERTLLAWVRTATSMISFGFTIYKFFQYMQERGEAHHVRRLIGPNEFALLMVVAGLGALTIATYQYWQTMRAMRSQFGVIARSMAPALAGLIALLGLITVLAVVFGL